MTLAEKINSNSYLKVSNCTDIADLEYAMNELKKLNAEFGEDNKTLLKLWTKFLDKKKKFEAMTKRKALDLPTEVVKFYQLKAIEQDKSVKKIMEEVLIKAAKA
jgi:hypothetical protein